MKKRVILVTGIICIFSLFVNMIDVFAGTIHYTFQGNNTVTVGQTIDLTMRVSDIKDFEKGLTGAQGNLLFDQNYLEYVSHEAVSSNLYFTYSSASKIFAGFGMDGKYVKSSEDLIKFTFRAKQPGTTKVSLSDVLSGDAHVPKPNYHPADIQEKTIQIVATSENAPSGGGNSGGNSGGNKPSGGGSSGSNGGGGSSSTNKGGSSGGTTSSKKSSDNTLSSLIVNNAKMSPSFDKGITSYQIVVPSDVDKLDLDYIASNSKAKVTVLGNKNLKDGTNNVVQIVVTAEDGSKKTYTLNVEKSSDSSSNKLEKLEVKESSLSPKFDSDVNEYTIKLKDGIDKLTIDAIPVDKDSKVEIIDNKNLSKNNSVVLVKVTDKNGFSNYYKLKVDDSKKNKLFGIPIKYIIWGLLGFILLLFLLLFLILWKRRKEEEEEQKPIQVHVVDHEEVNEGIYDDVVTKDEIIEAIEEKNPKKLKMLLTQEEANRLKSELKEEEKEE